MEQLSVHPFTSLNRFIPCIVALSILGCSMQAPYMRGWDLVPHHTHRWSDGAFKVDKLSEDETAVYSEFGIPDTIRFFRTLQTRQHVYEWLYQESNRIVWFVDGERVDYIAVDAKTSGLEKETRETVNEKLTKGGILAGIVGGITAGVLIFGKNLGLKD